MSLASLDLNLVVALRALLEERNVTRAGRRIGLSQPAMSAALAGCAATYGVGEGHAGGLDPADEGTHRG